MGHAERLEDVLRDIGLERLAGDALHDVAGQGRAVVGIGGRRAGLVHPLGDPLLHRIGQGPHALGVGVDQVADRLLEAAGVGHQPAQGDRAVGAFRNLEIEVGVDVLVEVELALADQLHHRRPGEQLADRAGPEDGVGGDRRLLRHVRIAIALHQDRLAVLDHRHHRARDVAAAQSIGHEAVEPGLHIGLVQHVAGRGLRRGGDRRRHRRRLDRGPDRLGHGGRRQHADEQ